VNNDNPRKPAIDADAMLAAKLDAFYEKYPEARVGAMAQFILSCVGVAQDIARIRRMLEMGAERTDDVKQLLAMMEREIDRKHREMFGYAMAGGKRRSADADGV
jgi:hypothetical protein